MERKRLAKGDVICLSRNGGSPQECRIDAFDGEGATAICYIAEFDGKIGRLKEFYPLEAIDHDGNISEGILFERRDDNELSPVGASGKNRFRNLLEGYLDAYKIIEDARKTNMALNNYIPSFEILHGVPEADSTVYVWTPNDKNGILFDAYISSIHEEGVSIKKPVHKLYVIIEAVKTLTECIYALHNAGLLHLDIKPTNVLIERNSEDDLNPTGISVFDIGSVFINGGDYPPKRGTVGFTAQEVLEGNACIQSDIFSIGAVLFHAIVSEDDSKDRLFHIHSNPSMYNDLMGIVSRSPLLSASMVTSDNSIAILLAGILKRTLAPSIRRRFTSCSELIRELEKVRALLSAGETDRPLAMMYKRLEIVEDDGITDHVRAAIQRQLFNKPFISANDSQRSIKILTLGAGTYAHMFIDLCLQLGQLPGYEISIDAYSNNSEMDCELYTAKRPFINRFVDVNDSLGGLETRDYGTLRFLGFESFGEMERNGFLTSSEDGHEKINKQILGRILTKENYSYVFVALRDNELNRELMEGVSAYADGHGLKIVSCYIYSGDNTEDENAICIRKEEEKNRLWDSIGFNAHLIWKNSWNMDLKTEKEEYKSKQDKYNYDSSSAYALSILYKLLALGIKIESSEDVPDAVNKYISMVLTDSGNSPGNGKTEVFKSLSAAEHRRWVIEKLTDGWKPPELNKDGKPDYDSLIVNGVASDKAKRIHPCIVRGTGERPLSGVEYETKDAWDKASSDEDFDELDTMSLQLHRCMNRYAKMVRKDRQEILTHLLSIRRALSFRQKKYQKARNAYEYCIKCILDGSVIHTLDFDKVERNLLKAVDGVKRSVIETACSNIRKKLFPVIEDNLFKFRNYKEINERLIENIPFILSYYQASLIQAFQIDKTKQNQPQDADILFKNIASALVIHPLSITYMFYAESMTELNQFFDGVSAVKSLLRERGDKTAVSYVVAVNRYAQDAFDMCRIIEEKQSMYITVDEPSDCYNAILNHITVDSTTVADTSTLLFDSLTMNSGYIRKLEELRIPYYEFHSRNQSFPFVNGCDFVKYIGRSASITVREMFALRKAKDSSWYYPDYADDYTTFWDIYSGSGITGTEEYSKNIGNSVATWNSMCKELKAGCLNKVIVFNTEAEGVKIKRDILLPEFCFETATYVVKKLMEANVLNSSSSVSAYNSEMCTASIESKYDISKPIIQCFSALYSCNDIGLISVNKYGDYATAVQFENLHAEKLDIKQGTEEYCSIEKLEGKNLLFNVERDDKGTVTGLYFPSLAIKKMLTIEGHILETFLYYEIYKRGYFDDVVCGINFTHGAASEVMNEFDCVFTKGFRTYVAECKSKKELEADNYYKLDSLTRYFGINVTSILIGNTYEKRKAVTERNDLHTGRGDEIGIITIRDFEDISNIGQVMESIDRGNFH